MSALLRATLSAAMISTAVASCAYGTTLQPRAEGAIAISEFGYTGAIGPANWLSLNTTTNSACAEGSHQSPIDITDSVVSSVAGSDLKITIPDFAEGAVFENLGSTIEIIGEGGSLVLPSSNKTFNFKQLHFHTPSEHLESGKSMAMEVHFVFQADDAEISVLGVYIDIADATTSSSKRRQNTKRQNGKRSGCKGGRGSASTSSTTIDTNLNSDVSTNSASAASSIIETIFASASEISEPGTETTTAALAMSDVVTFLQSTTFRTYSGSLTTPPCSEGVNWHVAADMLTISVSSYKAARDVIGFNSRFPQSNPGEENVLSSLYTSMSG